MAIENTMIRKGAKVRFLDAVGGGVVVGFSDKNTVIVEDEDGFEVPVLANKLVVVDDGSDKRMQQYSPASASAPKQETQTQGATIASLKKRLHDEEEREDEDNQSYAGDHGTISDDPADKPITYRPTTQERKGGDELNIFLCFEPVHEKDLGAGEWNMYLVNDSNYCTLFTFLSGENNAWTLRHTDTVEPNTTLLIEKINRDSLNELLNICLQMLFFKEDRTFARMPAASLPMRLDLTRFYKWHLYQPNDFFLHPVLTIPLIKNEQAGPRAFKQVRQTGPEVITQLAQQETADHGDTPKTITIRLDEMQKAQTKPASASPTHTKPASLKGNEVIDLHIDSLLDNTNGLSPKDILEFQIDTFRHKMDEYRNKKGKHLIFIHGKGEGVLRSKILSILKHDYPSCVFQDASFREYGFGATLVIIR